MAILSSKVLKKIKVDLDDREEVIRTVVYDALSQLSGPDLSESIVATYFVWSNSLTLAQIGEDTCYHMTSGVHHPQENTLLDQCTGKVVDCVCFLNQIFKIIAHRLQKPCC